MLMQQEQQQLTRVGSFERSNRVDRIQARQSMNTAWDVVSEEEEKELPWEDTPCGTDKPCKWVNTSWGCCRATEGMG